MTVFYSLPPPSAEMLRFTDEFAVLLKTRIAFCGQFLQGAQFASQLSSVTFELLHNSASQSDAQKMHLALTQMQEMSPSAAVISSDAGVIGKDGLNGRRKIREYTLPLRTHKPIFYEVFLLISRAWKYTKQTVC
jgi:hypothetical protein